MTTTTPSHLDLLTIAEAVRRHSVTGDTDGLHAELELLRRTLAEHVLAEQGLFADLPDSEAAVARDGQERLVALVDELLEATGGDCNCLVRAAEVDVVLARQTRLEDALFARHRRGR